MAPPRRAPPATPPRAEPARPGRLRRSWDRHWYAWAMVLPGRGRARRADLLPAGPRHLPVVHQPHRGQPARRDLHQVDHRRRGLRAQPERWQFVGLDNYTNVLSGEVGEFWQWFGITLIWTVACVVFHYAHRAGAGGAAQPADARARRLPGAADPALGGAGVRQRVRLAVHVQRAVRSVQLAARQPSAWIRWPGSTTGGPRCSPRSSPTSGSACRS